LDVTKPAIGSEVVPILQPPKEGGNVAGTFLAPRNETLTEVAAVDHPVSHDEMSSNLGAIDASTTVLEQEASKVRISTNEQQTDPPASGLVVLPRPEKNPAVEMFPAPVERPDNVDATIAKDECSPDANTADTTPKSNDETGNINQEPSSVVASDSIKMGDPEEYSDTQDFRREFPMFQSLVAQTSNRLLWVDWNKGEYGLLARSIDDVYDRTPAALK
jgi:hypothetical protein